MGKADQERFGKAGIRVIQERGVTVQGRSNRCGVCVERQNLGVLGVGGDRGILHGGGNATGDSGGSKRCCQRFGNACKECREQDRGSGRSAHRPKEGGGACGDPDVTRAHRVLAGDGESLHELAEAEAHQEHAEHGERDVTFGCEEGEHIEAQDHERRSHAREPFVTTGAGHELTAGDGGNHEPQNHREHLETALGGSGSLDELEVQGNGHHCTEHAKTDEDAEDRGHGEGLRFKHLQRDQGVVTHGALNQDESNGAENPQAVAEEGCGRIPAPLATLFGNDQEGNRCRDNGGRAPPVDAHATVRGGKVQEAQHDGEGDEADRQVNEEYPAPTGEKQNLVGAR